jgi:hypothetical protein
MLQAHFVSHIGVARLSDRNLTRKEYKRRYFIAIQGILSYVFNLPTSNTFPGFIQTSRSQQPQQTRFTMMTFIPYKIKTTKAY